MVGTQRSGSNLLRLILGSLPGVYAPPSAHELRDFLRLSERYAPLQNTTNMRRLVEDVGQLVDLNALPWPKIPDRTQAVLSVIKGTTIAHAVVAFYDAHAHHFECSAWLSKCLENVYYVKGLLATELPTVYLHLVRDPRDVAMSFLKAPIGPKEPRAIALRWRSDQEAAQRAKQTVSEASWLTLRYEDLVQDPQRTMVALCSWSGLEWQEEALNFYRTHEAAATANLSSLWTNLNRPVDVTRVGSHWQDRAFADAVEEFVWDLMGAYGYAPRGSWPPVRVSEQEAREIEDSDRQIRRKLQRQRNPHAEELHLRREVFLERLGMQREAP
jgi:hypothetical protein